MAHRRFVLLGIGGVIALVVAMTLLDLNENLTYYLYPTEAVDQKADFADGERFRLAGLVVEVTSNTSPSPSSCNVSPAGCCCKASLFH